MEPTLLTYSLMPPVQLLVESLCRNLGIRCVPVPPEKQGLSLGALLGLLAGTARRKGCALRHAGNGIL